MVDLQRYRATSGERNFIERIKAPIFLDAVLAIEIMWEPQTNVEEKVNSSILKYYFSSRTDPSIFNPIEPVLLDRSNETSWVFPALKSKSHFLPQCLADQIQVHKPIQVVVTDQMPDHT